MISTTISHRFLKISSKVLATITGFILLYNVEKAGHQWAMNIGLTFAFIEINWRYILKFSFGIETLLKPVLFVLSILGLGAMTIAYACFGEVASMYALYAVTHVILANIEGLGQTLTQVWRIIMLRALDISLLLLIAIGYCDYTIFFIWRILLLIYGIFMYKNIDFSIRINWGSFYVATYNILHLCILSVPLYWMEDKQSIFWSSKPIIFAFGGVVPSLIIGTFSNEILVNKYENNRIKIFGFYYLCYTTIIATVYHCIAAHMLQQKSLLTITIMLALLQFLIGLNDVYNIFISRTEKTEERMKKRVQYYILLGILFNIIIYFFRSSIEVYLVLSILVMTLNFLYYYLSDLHNRILSGSHI